MKPAHAALAVAVTAVWGFNFVVIEWGLQDVPPLVLLTLRFAIAACAVVVLARPALPWRLIAGIALSLAVVKFGLLFVGMDVGITAGLASLVLQCQALFTVLLAALVIGERPGRGRIAGITLGFAGIALVGAARGGDVTVLGIVLVVAAGAAWAVANLLMKKASGAEPLAVIAWMSLAAVPILAPLSLAGGGWGRLDLQALAAATFIAVVATLGGFGAWSWLMRTYDAGQVASFALLVPVFGMGFGALLLDEGVTPAHVAGAALVLAGLALVVRPQASEDLDRSGLDDRRLGARRGPAAAAVEARRVAEAQR